MTTRTKKQKTNRTLDLVWFDAELQVFVCEQWYMGERLPIAQRELSRSIFVAIPDRSITIGADDMVEPEYNVMGFEKSAGSLVVDGRKHYYQKWA